jgi:DNA-binding Lrp family transcriptional regulator
LEVLDVRIFCEMGFKYFDYDRYSERRISPTQIGKTLGVSEKTVRLRVKKMEDGGFIKYYQAMPNLRLFGLNEICSCHFDAPDVQAKSAAIEHLLKAPSVVEVDDFLGPRIMVGVACTSAEEAGKAAPEMASKVGLIALPGGMERKIRASTIQPNNLDWRLIRELRYDALRETKDIAESLYITYRMAEYRIERLLESGALFVVAPLNPRHLQGIILYYLVLIVDPAKYSNLLSQLQEKHGEKLWHLRTPNSQTILAALLSSNSGEPEDEQLAASRMDGVRQCVLLVHKEKLEPERPSWIDRAIDTKIEGRTAE